MTPSPQREPRRAPFAAFLIAYFLYFTWEGVRAPFSPDDMMNLAEHWVHGPFRAFYSNLMLWHDFYRPMGALFYLPVFSAFGLNPLPYHIVLLGLVLLYVALVYRLAQALGASPLEAWLAALIVAYHGGLANLYYETIHIYDVLCGLFYVGALICYAGARAGGRTPRKREIALFFVLFVCALNSKEMAVTLPVMLLAYEWLWHGKARRLGIAAASFAVAAVYVYGRVLHGLAQSKGYAVSYSLAQVGDFQRRQFQDLFFAWRYSGWAVIAGVWILVTFLAWRRNRPLLRFCWIFVIVTPLPVEVLEARGMAVLAIPLAGWAMLAAAVLLALMRVIANALANEPGFRRFGPRARLATVVALFVGVWAWWNRDHYVTDVRREIWDAGYTTAQVIRQFQTLRPRVRPHSRVVFLNDPFDGWDMAFIGELWFRDRTVNIVLQKKTPLGAAELARADYLFDWRDGRLVAAGGAATASGSPLR